MKFEDGSITNLEGKTAPIIVEASFPVKAKDCVIGGIAIGMGIYGIGYLIRAAFRYGSQSFQEAELRTMMDLGIIKD